MASQNSGTSNRTSVCSLELKSLKVQFVGKSRKSTGVNSTSVIVSRCKSVNSSTGKDNDKVELVGGGLTLASRRPPTQEAAAG